MFAGDPTGSTDVSAALATFLSGQTGTVCLAPGATYRVTQVLATGVHDLVLEGQGATILGVNELVAGIIRLRSANGVTLRNITVRGTSSVFDLATEFGSGFYVDGGRDVTLDHVRVRTVRGDGIYVGYNAPLSTPAEGVRIIAPDLSQLGRNGIAPVAGEVTILGGKISHAGLFGIDFECGTNAGCASIVGSVTNTAISSVGEQWTGKIHYAVAAGGLTTATKQSISVVGITADAAYLTIRNTLEVNVSDNVSETAATAGFPGCGNVTFVGNVRIARVS